ncbi:MAG: hypothetical protein WEE89_11595 [Gemmatimonadota bacterium]
MKVVRIAALLTGAGLVLAAPNAATTQGITVSPMVGAYVPAGSFRELQAQAGELERGSTLGLGLNVGLGMLRASLAYASGATISRDGIDGEEEIGDGSVLVGAADLVIRPLPKLIVVQPYLLGGIGYKKEDYSFDDDPIETIPDDEKTVVLHAGVGLDISLGRLSLVGEVSDFIGRNNEDKWKVHDAFAMIGLKFRLF